LIQLENYGNTKMEAMKGLELESGIMLLAERRKKKGKIESSTCRDLDPHGGSNSPRLYTSYHIHKLDPIISKKENMQGMHIYI